MIADRYPFGFNNRGRIEVGRKADLVLVDGDIREFLTKGDNLCLLVRGLWTDGVAEKVF